MTEQVIQIQPAPKAHARRAPSSAFRWKSCTASVGEEAGKPDGSNEASRNGTAVHAIAEIALINGSDTIENLGNVVGFPPNRGDEVVFNPLDEGAPTFDQFEYTVRITKEFQDWAERYVSYVREQVALSDGMLFVEQRVPIDHITFEEGAKGTTDAAVIKPALRELHVIDLKTGRNQVNAYDVVGFADMLTDEGELIKAPVLEPNDQLAMYADGSLIDAVMFAEIDTVRLTIVQPSINHISDFSLSVADLKAHIQKLRDAAHEGRTNPTYRPSTDNCQYCKGRDTCAARTDDVLATVLGQFTDLSVATPVVVPSTQLGVVYSKLGMIQQWCADQERRVLEALQAGEPVVRADGLAYKMVMGREGRRAWRNADEAEVTMQKMRLRADDMYDRSLISPTSAEKLSKAPKPKDGEEPVKPVLGKRQWTKLQELITRAEAKPTVALETDVRPAVATAASVFTDLSAAQPATTLQQEPGIPEDAAALFA